jgi:ketosteroid isomerase-like protein
MIENSRTIDEVQIRLLLNEFRNLLQTKDSERILSLYSPEIVVFDVSSPLQRVGTKAYGKAILEWFDSYRGPIAFEIRDLHLAVSADVAFSHSLIRTSGTMKSGQEIDRWQRWTLCLRKISGKWLITHEHVSLPVDQKSGNAVQDLQP